jgi:hypothetical protein
MRWKGLTAVVGMGLAFAGSGRAVAHRVGEAPFVTSAPAYDANAGKRRACTFRRGDKTAKTIGANAPSGNALPFKHIIVLMMENRSFDHYYGALSKPNSYGNAVDVATEQNCNPDPATKTKVCRYRETRYCVKNTAHTWEEVHAQFNGGRLDGFVESSNPNGARAMGYFTDEDLPFYYWLSNTFAISDRYFSPLPGPTWPNRWFLFGATSWGEPRRRTCPSCRGSSSAARTPSSSSRTPGRRCASTATGALPGLLAASRTLPSSAAT